MDKRRIGASILFLLGLMVAVSACNSFHDNDIGPVQTQALRIPLDEAETVRLEIFNGVGDVRLYTDGTAADEILAGTLTYNVAKWAPQISYDVNAAHEGQLSVRQPELLSGLGFEDVAELRYEYDLAVNPAVPIDLTVEIGVGSGNIDLKDQHLTHLTLRMGAGTGHVDLSQIKPANLDVLVLGGVGRTTILLPSDIGVKVTVIEGGLNRLTTTGLTQRDEMTFINDAYHTAVPTLDIILEPTAGSIDLHVVP